MNGIAFVLATVTAIALTGFTMDPFALGFSWLFVYVLIFNHEAEIGRIHREH